MDELHVEFTIPFRQRTSDSIPGPLPEEENPHLPSPRMSGFEHHPASEGMNHPNQPQVRRSILHQSSTRCNHKSHESSDKPRWLPAGVNGCHSTPPHHNMEAENERTSPTTTSNSLFQVSMGGCDFATFAWFVGLRHR